MEDPIEPLSEEDVTFTMVQLMRYFADVGRSTQCPLCPHHGEWIFHSTEEQVPRMIVHTVPRPSFPSELVPVALVECPNCGFMAHTSLIRVYKHFRAKSNG